MWKIPVANADVSGKEEEYVVEAVRSSWISSAGKFVDRFEQEFRDACQTNSAIACSNGTVALHLALMGLKLEPGDEVIIPSLTYIATANAVRYCGAEPVFVDVDPNTWCVDPAAVEDAITSRTKGIIAVHLMGHPCDMDALNRIAAMNGLWVVEDAAESHFAYYKGKPVGGLGTLGTFSFFGNKVLTCGEGGAVTVNDSQLEIYLRMLRGQGMDPQRRYYFPITGYNYRLTNVACALLCAQMERRDAIIGRRREIFDKYNEQLSAIPGVELQPVAEWAKISPWMVGCLINHDEFGATRDEVMQGLAEQGIDSRPFFFPLHKLPPFREAAGQQDHDLRHTNDLANRGVMLPTFNSLTDSQIEQVAQGIASVQSARRRRAA